MKKFYSLLAVAAMALLGLQAQGQQVWLVGDAFNGWNESGNVEMTNNNGVFTYTAEIGAGKYFAFFKDQQAWGSQRGPANGNNSQPTGNWEETTSGGSWYVATAGTYEISYEYATDKAKIAAVSVAPFDATKRNFAVTGAAFGGWNMPPVDTQTFTNNGDGTYTLVFEGAVAGEFKLSGVADNIAFSESWDVFNSGCYYNSTLAEGDNILTFGGTSNMTLPVSGNVTLTISDVTAQSCKLNITVGQIIVPDKAYYLAGTFNNWAEQSADHKFTEVEDGKFQLTQTFSGEFKIVNEYKQWLGGNGEITLTAENPSVTLVDGSNITLAEESEYTLTIENGVLTVTGFPEATRRIAGTIIDTNENHVEGVKVTAKAISEGSPYEAPRRAIGDTYTTTTDPDGYFSLEVPENFTYEVTFEKEGYKTVTVHEMYAEGVILEPTQTGVNTLNVSDITSVKYVNAAGVTANSPFTGLNIVVTTLTDGTTRVSKMVK